MKDQIRVGIVGAGLIGAKRAEAILKSKKGTLVAIADVDHARAKMLAEKYGVESAGEWKKFVARKDIDAIIVAVPNTFAAPIVLAALKSGKHVFCEKPFGITAKQSASMIQAAKKAKKLVKVGFNHRFQPAVMKAHEIFEKGGIGKVLFIRSRYGHGGRPGMEKEWRFNKKISGGGELLDQGVHIVDLARWFGGEFKTVYGRAETKFWKTKLDDNAFALMENKQVTVSFHVSTTQWKNLFSFEVFGELGFLQIDGKGGSYGEESLIYAKRKLGMAPDMEVSKFPGPDESWEREWENFEAAILKKEKLLGAGEDGLQANRLIEAIYRSSASHKEIRLT
jgi:predicted dehydrogenase